MLPFLCQLEGRALRLLVWVVSMGLALALADVPRAHAVTEQVTPWQGEFFTQNQGAFYFKARANDPTGTLGNVGLDGEIRVTLYSVIERRSYVFNQSIIVEKGRPSFIWKLPAGKYWILKVDVVDTQGATRTWQPKKPDSIVIQRQCMSNLGLWVLRPKGKTGLAVTFKMVPNSYWEKGGEKDKSSIAAVINGFRGFVQKRFAGVERVKASRRDHSTGEELRGTMQSTRQIAMFYKLNLFKHNQYAQDVSDVLNVYDAKLRTCYTDRLDFNENLRGNITFRFILSRETGTMRKISFAKGTLNDPKMIECLILELAQIQFPPKETMIGELTYTFDFQ